MNNFIEVIVPRPEPTTLAQYKKYVELTLKDIEAIKGTSTLRPIDTKITKFENETY